MIFRVFREGTGCTFQVYHIIRSFPELSWPICAYPRGKDQVDHLQKNRHLPQCASKSGGVFAFFLFYIQFHFSFAARPTVHQSE